MKRHEHATQTGLLRPAVRKWDRETVSEIPAYLAKVGLEVRESPEAA